MKELLEPDLILAAYLIPALEALQSIVGRGVV